MKHVYRILVAIVLLIGIGLIGLHFYFSPTRLHALIQPYLQNTLQRQVSFQNTQLRYGLEPRITLDNLIIQDRQTFSKQPFIQAQKADMVISPIAFLMGKNRIGTLHLQNSHIILTRNRQGTYNIQDLMQAKIRLPINQLQLTHTTITHHNQQIAQKTTLHIQNANLLVSPNTTGITLTGDTQILNLVTQTKTDSTHLPAFGVALQLTYTPTKPNIIVDQLAIDMGPIVVNLSGHINWQTRVTDLHTKNTPIDFDHLKNYLIKQTLLTSQATLSGNGQLDLHITGTWPLNIKGQLKTTNITLSAPNTLKNPIVNGEISLSTDAKSVRLHALKLQSGLTDITLAGVLSNLYQNPHLSFALHSHTIDLDGFLAPSKVAQAQWGIVSPVHATTNTKKSALISFFNHLDMDGSIRADSLRIHNTWIKNLKATTQTKNGTLNIKPIMGQTHNGALNSNLQLTTNEQGAYLESNLSLINAHAHPLLNQTLGWKIPLYGNLTLTTQVTTTFDSTFALLPSTTKANGRLSMQAGKLIKWEVLQNNLKSVEQLGLLTADEVLLQNATVAFTLTGNTLALNGTQLTAAQMPCRITGTGDLDGLLNYTLDIDVPSSRIQFGGFNLGALLGQHTIPVRINIGGSAQAPNITAGIR